MIATPSQGEGVGSALIQYGLQNLRDRGVSVAMTYGDPAYYGRLGFAPVTEATIAAPLPPQDPSPEQKTQ